MNLQSLRDRNARGSLKRIYLDFASATPLSARAEKAMRPWLSRYCANPSAIHSEGLEARAAVEKARKEIAAAMNCHPDEIVFTSGGTESDNLAIRGAVGSWKSGARTHIISSVIEHPAILETVRALSESGIKHDLVSVKENGIIDPQEIKKALKPETAVVSVSLANGEIGTIQPVAEIARAIRSWKKERAVTALYPLLHVDASQAAGLLFIDCTKLNCDLMTLDASKFYGPKGVGILYVRRGIDILPQQTGGLQEGGRRAGSENLPGIVGCAAALVEAEEKREKEVVRLTKLRDEMISSLTAIPGVTLNGDAKERIANNVNICVEGVEAERLVIELDALGISCSSATACNNLTNDPTSYVIESLGENGKKCAGSSLRFSLGRSTKAPEIKRVAEILKILVPVLR